MVQCSPRSMRSSRLMACASQCARADVLAVAQLVAGFVDVAVAHADFVVAVQAGGKALGQVAFNAAHPVIARRERNKAPLVQKAAAQGFGEKGVHAGFALALFVLVAGSGQGAAAPEAVQRAGGLVGVLAEVRSREAAGHFGAAFVVLNRGVNGVGGLDLVAPFEDDVVNVRLAVFAPVAAARAGIQQRHAQAIGSGAAQHEVGGFLG